MTLYLTKPLQLDDGRPARLLASDLKGNYNIAVAVSEMWGQDVLLVFDKDGINPDPNTPRLINAPPKPVTIKRWVRVEQSEFSPDGYMIRAWWPEKPVIEGVGQLVGPIDITFTPKE